MSEENEKPRVLYVDDERNNLTTFKSTFRREFSIFTAESGDEGKTILDKEKIDVIITDQRMPGMTGVQFLESVLGESESPVVPSRILLTGYSDIDAVIDAINKGKVFAYLNKPWNEEELRKTILEAYDIFKLQNQKNELTKSLLRVNKQLEFMLRQRIISRDEE